MSIISGKGGVCQIKPCADLLLLIPAAGLQPVLVLLLRRQSAADVAFLFVHVKNFADALRQGRVDLLQAVGAVFMFGRHNLERFHFLQLKQFVLELVYI